VTWPDRSGLSCEPRHAKFSRVFPELCNSAAAAMASGIGVLIQINAFPAVNYIEIAFENPGPCFRLATRSRHF
jgi:hypothetical protein